MGHGEWPTVFLLSMPCCYPSSHSIVIKKFPTFSVILDHCLDFPALIPTSMTPDDGSDRTLRNQPSPLHHKLLCPYFPCCSLGSISTGEKESPGCMQLPPLHGHPLLQLSLCHLPEVPVSFSCLWGAGCCCHVCPGHPTLNPFIYSLRSRK